MRRRRIEVHIERHEFSISAPAASQSIGPEPAGSQSRIDAQRWPTSGFGSGVGSGSRLESCWTGNSGSEESFPVGVASVGQEQRSSLCCRICGAQEMLPLAQAIAEARLTAIALKEGLETGRYHLHCTPNGDWLLCAQSMQLD